MKCSEFIKILKQQADETYACSWDNVGLLVGSSEKEIHKIYIALDASDEAIAEAIAERADLLLTHHPLIFQGMHYRTGFYWKKSDCAHSCRYFLLCDAYKL